MLQLCLRWLAWRSARLVPRWHLPLAGPLMLYPAFASLGIASASPFPNVDYNASSARSSTASAASSPSRTGTKCTSYSALAFDFRGAPSPIWEQRPHRTQRYRWRQHERRPVAQKKQKSQATTARSKVNSVERDEADKSEPTASTEPSRARRRWGPRSRTPPPTRQKGRATRFSETSLGWRDQ